MDSIEIISLKEKFLTFYDKANNRELSEDERWNLWEKEYNFAAVPPGEEGRGLARRLFEEAWTKYEDHIEEISNWTVHKEKIEEYLKKIKAELGYDDTINLVLIYFVGTFEGNAFCAPYHDGRMALCLPIENSLSDILLVHELTHIVHAKIADISLQWERTVASVVLSEGLAMHLSKMLIPGYSDESYTEFSDGWLQSCIERREDILKGIYPYLDNSTDEIVYLFTMGRGITNNEREAYFAGWELLEKLFNDGVTLKELAQIKELDMPKFVTKTFDYLLYKKIG